MESSAVVLVKNEEWFLPYTLVQTEGYFDSYVIYDVGSTDRTQEIIQWWIERMDGKADIFVRYLPHVDPLVQGAFRNSMILEGARPFYYILDGDELYSEASLKLLEPSVEDFHKQNRNNARKMYGVVKRVEVNADLTQQYVERRGHHRLYASSAWWEGTHPGERAVYAQNEKSEVRYDDIVCWHMHNTIRSSKNSDALKREVRKGQKSYHPGSEMAPLNLLDELPLLRKPIGNFAVSPALAELQEKYNGQ
jgi:glycosyltransferase involved in cell wall biosynthesis